MSAKNAQRREQRRRLVVAWKRTAEGGQGGPPSDPRPMAEYAAEAHPERQRGPATLLPTGLGGLTLAVIVIVLPTAAAVVIGGLEPLIGRRVFSASGRFARTIGVLESCFDPRGQASLQAWLAQFNLLLAASVALIVRLMRRHRRDDFEGRYRAWGWLSCLFLATACAGVVPVGRLCGAAIADATGISLGPDGLGWWIALAAVAYGGVSLWTVLPLHERTGTAWWLVLALASWSGSAACTWLAGGAVGLHAILATGLWSLAAACAAVAMLAAARSVIREVRGVPGRAPSAADHAVERETEPPVEPAADEVPDFTPESTDGDTAYVDGSESESEHRHLSKAERKRLKRLARMKSAAA